ncbi:MAG: hypothetical protein A2066_06745 [Bacteroidetes bacterium GWB2_41_8]|nr:MAG: hypothetical protein A2066_06745 [Bacteroidetes bacterium GWB2_41_8]
MNTYKNTSPRQSENSISLRKIILLSLCLFLLKKLDAQNITENRTNEYPRFYVGFGTGFDNFTGLMGVSGTLKMNEKISMRGGVGLSGWGFKNSIGIKYDLKETGGWSYCLGYSYSPGFEGLKMDNELESGGTKEITVDYLSASTINLAFDRNWKIGKANIFYIELGYAIPLQSNRWRTTDGSVLTRTNEAVLKLLQPGGLILGAGFAFRVF